MSKLFKLTGWKLLRPARTPWGEQTNLWTEADWEWFRTYQPGAGVSPLTANETVAGGRGNGETFCDDCAQQMTPEEIHYYERRCENCERAWSDRMGKWMRGETVEPELDSIFSGHPRSP